MKFGRIVLAVLCASFALSSAAIAQDEDHAQLRDHRQQRDADHQKQIEALSAHAL